MLYKNGELENQFRSTMLITKEDKSIEWGNKPDWVTDDLFLGQKM